MFLLMNMAQELQPPLRPCFAELLLTYIDLRVCVCVCVCVFFLAAPTAYGVAGPGTESELQLQPIATAKLDP